MSVWLFILRWFARLSGLLVGGAFFLLLFAEITNPHSGPPSNFLEWFGIVLMIVACAAMLTAWRWELSSALFSLVAIATFGAVFHGNGNYHGVLFFMMIPGILYAADWFAHRTHSSRHPV
jgi:hypothetical protein